MDRTIIDQVVRRLESLPPDRQLQVLDFVQKIDSSSPGGVSGDTLLRFVGAIKADDLQAMTKAIEEGCERIFARK
jgi:hypothetical protein